MNLNNNVTSTLTVQLSGEDIRDAIVSSLVGHVKKVSGGADKADVIDALTKAVDEQAQFPGLDLNVTITATRPVKPRAPRGTGTRGRKKKEAADAAAAAAQAAV